MAVTTTTWPDGNDLLTWVGGVDNVTDRTLSLLDDLVADATATIVEKVDSDKLLPLGVECPRPIARAIVLEAARLLSRKDSTHGIVSFGEFAVRLASVDADITDLLTHWGLDPEA